MLVMPSYVIHRKAKNKKEQTKKTKHYIEFSRIKCKILTVVIFIKFKGLDALYG